jgi:hypothetical protein
MSCKVQTPSSAKPCTYLHSRKEETLKPCYYSIKYSQSKIIYLNQILNIMYVTLTITKLDLAGQYCSVTLLG